MSESNESFGIRRIVGHLLLGTYFGLVLVKSEAVSWFRIQEMFRFDSFHMYGILGSGVVVAAVSVLLIKKFNVRTVSGEPIHIETRKWENNGIRYWAGGTVFGLGWAFLGACPGPIYALIGTGISVMIAALVAGLAGAWAYGMLQERLPH